MPGRISKHPILEFKRGNEVTFFFNEKPLKGYANETIAAALHANGVYQLKKSAKLKRPRGLFCAIGRCASCQMEVNGKPNVKICTKKVEEGMKVREQKDFGDLIQNEKS